MSLESCTETIRTRVGEDCGLGATLKFDFGDAGVILIDATKVPNVVNNENGEAACTIGVTLEDFENMMSGELAPTTAFMGGKLKVEGDMGIAMKLQTVL